MSEDARMNPTAMLERIVSSDPATPLYLPLAEKMREQGRIEEAIRLCEERRGRPGSGVGDRIVLGRCYLAAGRLPEARAQFEAAAELDRENVVALKALAGILSHDGDHTAAADLYRAVCRIDPGDLESQTALHHITSGEFPEVRPPDLVVGQGELTWQPVAPPREEEYLPEISLGLQTFEVFDAPAPPKPRLGPAVQDFQELAIERLEPERRESEPVSEPVSEPISEAPVSEAPVSGVPVSDPQAPAAAPAAPAAAAAGAPKAPTGPVRAPGFEWTELPRNVRPVEAAPKEHGIEGNKSAFDIWLKRLQGGGR